ncbi:MAG: RNB domain-containing ribonuclease, partial [Acaryochloridaceae cyanobacterium RL_2_7]|nr:RNB domain-containing ribonuclease [Acaryochloridaceae cyanobacterium RL_2_7]
ESWLASKKKLTYERADIIAQNSKAKFHKQFKLYQTWADKLAQQREAQGAFGGLLSKTGVLFDENGNVLTQDKFFHSQMIIQEFMILANRAVAQWFADRDILALYRNHTARAIAPEREELMNALLTTGNTELIRQKLQNWLNKATYEPTLTGHFALNLPAYCHFTSPIRRLPDLINHRIIKAKIHGKRHPYKRNELDQLCKYIGTVAEILGQEREEHHRKRTQQQFSRQLLNPEALEALPEKEFTNVLKHSFRDNNFAPIRDTAIARLNQGKLAVQDLFLLLIRGDDDIRQSVLGEIKEKPEDAPSIIAMGLNQEPTWEDFDYLEETQGANFIFWAQVMIGKQPFTTVHPAQDQKKQRSRHFACLAWLEAFVNGELVAPEQREKPKPPVVEVKTEATTLCEDVPSLKPQSELHPSLINHLKEGQNFVGLLLELFQGMKWETPTFEDTEADEGFSLCLQGDRLGEQL